MQILLVASGPPAYFVARRFLDAGHHVTLVVDGLNEATRLSRSLEGAIVVNGDGARPDVLDDAGALHADVLVAATLEDHRNLVACQMGRNVFFIRRTLAVVNDPDNREVFRSLGVDSTISVADLLSSIVAQKVASDDVRRLEAFAGGRALVTELVLSAGAAAVGARLADLDSGQGLVAMVIRGDDVLIAHGATRLEAGDRLLVVTAPGTGDGLIHRLLG